MVMENRARIAIACQGGGSHTAFTAGVLSRFLRPDVLDRYRVTGISGTSGGAICALLGWSALMDDDPGQAEPRLRAFWADNSASTPVEWFVNAFLQWSSELSHYVAMPSISPYRSPASTTALTALRAMLDRAVDFDDLRDRAVAAGADAPQLLLGAVDVLSGGFKAFDSRSGEVSVDAVLASAAIPTLFRSVPVNGGLYWDGLFSQNPPVRDLLNDLPDEVWVIQINPTARDDEPDTTETIADRRNELAGNLSLYQELAFIERINSMLDTGVISSENGKMITVRVLEMARPPHSQQRGYASKLNRDPAFLQELIDLGLRQADEFLAARGFENAWHSGDADAVLAYFAEDCLVKVAAPFRPLAATTDGDSVRALVTDRLTTQIEVNFNRLQLARETVTWKVRATSPDDGSQIDGTATVMFRGGKLVSFILGP